MADAVFRRRTRTADIPTVRGDLDLTRYERGTPDQQRAFDLFAGRWSSWIPTVSNTGNVPLFADHRIEWLVGELGDVSGWDVLDLGSLEGGHTWMLEQRGARVTAIEANVGAFLRCLVVKNQLDLRARFVLGDITNPDTDFGRRDLVIASGIFYHLLDPIEVVTRIASSTERLFIWTQYFDKDLDRWSVDPAWLATSPWDPDHPIVTDVEGHPIELVPFHYQERRATFSGGAEPTAYWFVRDDLLTLLGVLGFDDVQVTMDEPDAPNGPAFCVLAQRTAGGDASGRAQV